MKKKITIATVAALLASMTFSMAACTESDTDVLLPKKSGSYSASLSSAPFTGTSTQRVGEYYNGSYYSSYTTRSKDLHEITASDNTGIVVVKNEKYSYDSRRDFDYPDSTYSYSFYDLKTGSELSISSSSNAINNISSNLFYSVNTDSFTGYSTYTLYDTKSQSVIGSYLYGEIEEEVFYNADNNSRVYTDYVGNIRTENDPFAPILTENDNPIELSNFFVKDNSDSGTVWEIFDKNANFVDSVDITRKANIAIDAEIGYTWFVGDKIYFQTAYELPDQAEQYDFFEDEKKYNFDSYSIDLTDYEADDEDAEIEVETEDLDYVVSSPLYMACTPEYAILTVQSIDDNYMLSDSFVQSYDIDGDVYVDFQELAPGALFAMVYDDGIRLYDAYGKCYVYSGDELTKTFKYDLENYYSINGGSFAAYADSLYVYDNDGNNILTVYNVQDYGITNDGNLRYVTKNRGSNNATIYTYNAATRTENSIVSYATNSSEFADSHSDHKVLEAMYSDICIIKDYDYTSHWNSYIDRYEYDVEVTYEVYYLAGVSENAKTGLDEAGVAGTYYANDGASIYTVFYTLDKTVDFNNSSNYSYTYNYYILNCTRPTYEFVAED